MSDSSDTFGIVGDPLLGNTSGQQFKIEAQVRRHYYTAVSHRPLVSRIRITNLAYTGDAEELLVTVRAEAVGAPSLLVPWRRAYPMVDRRDWIDVDVLTLRPNLIQLASLDEGVLGDVVISVSVDGTTVEETRLPVDFLAYNQWFHTPLDFESLSSFVLPNHPVVAEIMVGVRKRLEANTGDGSTEGYQSYQEGMEQGATRVLEMARAVYDELQARDIRYSDPPASFEGYGQKVRTPDIIMREKVMTCLDSTVLVASCLAAAGLRPLLFVVAGHAFPGFWITPATAVKPDGTIGDDDYRDSVVFNVNQFQLLESFGLIGSFESTEIGLPSKKPFVEVLDRHKDFASAHRAGQFVAMIDVERASMVGVRRLPSRTVDAATGTVEVIEDDSVIEIAPVVSPELVLEGDSTEREKLDTGNIPPRVRKWMDALLDITNTNPLVNLVSMPVSFPPESKRRTTNSIELPMVEGLLGRVENALFDGRGLKLTSTYDLPESVLQNRTPESITTHFDATGQIGLGPVQEMMGTLDANVQHRVEEGMVPRQAFHETYQLLTRLHTNEITRRFKALKKLSDEIESQSATNQLFLTIGSLLWVSPGDSKRATKMVKSPLFVVPVRVSGSAQTGFFVHIEEGGELSPNYCLLEKLHKELGLRIADLETPHLDDAGIDVDNMIARIRTQLGNSKFSDMRVIDDCQLAVLNFATFRMWKDIQSNWTIFTRNTVVKHLVNGAGESLVEDLPSLDGEPLTPFDCDESQMHAVRWALEGRSFVLEGPPGTGKSQTIANIIAAGMAEGRRILFVAEKQVALEAVSRKLEEIGLDPFCITMHHESTTPESIRSQLQTSLDFVGLDISAQWNSESAVVGALQERLRQYRDSMITPNELGMSALRANQETLRLGNGPALDIDPATLPLLGPHLAEVRSALLQIRAVAGASRISAAPAWSLAVLDDPEALPKSQLQGALDELAGSLQQHSNLRPIVEPLMASSAGSIPVAVEKAIELVASGNAPTVEAAREINDPAWLSRISSMKTRSEAHSSLHRTVYEFFTPAAFTVDVTPQLTAANEAISAGLFSKKKKAETLRALVSPLARIPVDKEPAEILTLLQQLAPARDGLKQIVDEYRSIPHLTLRTDFDPMNSIHLDELDALAANSVAGAVCLLHPEAEVVRQLVSSGISLHHDDISTINRIVGTWTLIKRLIGATLQSEEAWRNGQSLWDAVSSSLEIWRSEAPTFPTLSKMALVNKTLAPLKVAGQSKLLTSILAGDVALDSIHDEFERGVFRASRSERLNQGALTTFDSGDFDRTVGDFARRVHSRGRLMRTVIPRQLSEARPFKPGIRTGAIGNLEKELGKKVRRVSIPKLIREHGEMITILTPCFLMSPEAVSRLLPAESQFFDMVIFDEASQIRVAAAIPAMGRGKSVIVVGDSKQMPPTKAVGKRQVGDSDNSPFEEDILQDLESILSECSESHLPSLMLQCHFRSQHEALISFSNRNFYDNRLVTFPAPNTDKTTPVSWFDVPDGEFLRSGDGKGTNPAEARAVVAEIVRRLNDPEHGPRSIGVVTFNEPQADLIYELLEEIGTGDPAVAAALNHPKKSERLFVVALEKVQGDERDTIMLSVSYSYQGGIRNKVSPQWGPLTNKGGERRLNVAITRAKKDLLIFCSFDPNHVDTSSSSYLGVPATVEFLKECRSASLSNGASLKSRATSLVDHQRKQLLARLRESGIRARENVGLSKFRIDLAVSDDSDTQFLALLLDTDEWASRSTPYDREVLPNSVLRLIGWRRVGRVWLKTAVEDLDRIVSLVRNELDRERLRTLLISTLKAKGYDVRDDSSLSRHGIDLAVRRAGQSRWPLAVAISGPDLFAQFFSHEGDLPREETLNELSCVEGLSVWMPDATVNLDAVISRIDGAIDRISLAMSYDNPDPAPAAVSPIDVAPIGSSAPNPAPSRTPLLLQSEYWSEFADATSLPALGDQSMLGPGVGYNPSMIKKAIDEVVEFEGPITQERLASLVVGRFGMERLRAARLEALKPMFGHLVSSTSPFGVVYWPSHRPPDSWTGFRTTLAENSRTIEEVPAEELANAMVAVVRMGDSATQEEILRFIADAHGRKLTEKVRTKLVAVLAWTVDNRRLTIDGAYFKMPPQ